DKNDAAMAKIALKSWLEDNGVDAYVEGALDVDVDHDYANPERDFYGELDGDLSPVSVYRYGLDELIELKDRLLVSFADSFKATIESHETKEWMDGWKESFKPFETAKVRVRPPWFPAEGKKHDVVIEPGMAFGTGQHA